MCVWLVTRRRGEAFLSKHGCVENGADLVVMAETRVNVLMCLTTENGEDSHTTVPAVTLCLLPLPLRLLTLAHSPCVTVSSGRRNCREIFPSATEIARNERTLKRSN